MTNLILSLKALKEDENNIISVINEFKQIAFRKSDYNYSGRHQNDKIVQNLSLNKSNLDYFEEWLKNLHYVMTETKNLIHKLRVLLKNKNEIPSRKEVIEMIGQIKKNFISLKITGQKKYDSLCVLEKNIEFPLENFFNFSQFCEIELPPLYKFEDTCEETIFNAKELDSLSNERHSESSNPIVIGQFLHNWHVKDHEIFLRVYKKFKNKNKRLEGLMQLLPHISKEKILSHHKKYNSYCESAEEAKSKIREWKGKKQLCVSMTKENGREDNTNKKPHNGRENNRNEKSQRNVSLSQASERRKIIKKQIELWKNKKNTINKQEEKSNVGKVELYKKSYSYTVEERANIKQKLEVYRSQKSLNILRENKIFKDNAKFTIKMNLHELRERDKAFILQRKSKINKIYEKRNLQIWSQSKKNGMDRKHNPENYRKLTISAECHMHPENSPTIVPVSVDLIPKLKIPQWKCSGT